MKNLTKLKVISFLWGVAFHMPIISLFFLNNGVNLQAIVISQTIYSIFSFLGEIPTGVLADKFGQKTAIFLGYMLEALGLAVMLFMPNISGLYLAYSLIGIAESFLSGSQEALVYESYHQEEHKGSYQKHYGIFLSNQLASFAITTFIGGILVNYFGSQIYPFLILSSALALILAALLAATLKRVRQITKLTAQVDYLTIIGKSFLLIKSHKTISSLMLITILTMSGEYFLYGVYQPYFEQAHVPGFYLGLVLSLGSVLNYFLLKYTYLFERFLPFEKIILVLNLPLALSYVLMAVFINPIFLVLSFILMKGLFEVQSPIISDYINEYTDSSIRTTVLSGISLTKSFFNVILRLTLAAIIGSIGIKSAFLVQGFYLLIGVLIGYWVLVRCGCTYKINSSVTSSTRYDID